MTEAQSHEEARAMLRRAIEALEAEEGEITQEEMNAAIEKMGGL